MRQMSHKGSHSSIRTLIARVTVLLTLLLSITFSVACFFLFQSYARSSVLRASEFNLQLVASLVSQDLLELNSISNLTAFDSDVTTFLKDEEPSRRAMLDVYETVRQRCNASQAQAYLQRLVVTDTSTRLVQAIGASSLTYNSPLTIYNIDKLPGILEHEESVWQEVVQDPFLFLEYPNSLLIVRPVYAPKSQDRIGTVYLTASTRLISDRLKNYDTSNGSLLFLSSPKGTWLIDGEKFMEGTPPYTIEEEDCTTARSDDTLIRNIRSQGQGKMISVSCPIGTTGLYITQCIPQDHLFAGQGVLWTMIGVMTVIVIIIGILLSRYLGRVIMNPISCLSRRMVAISGGDFSYDPSIEFDNEFGTVGSGINNLSHNMALLMDKKVSDEKEKQKLEYKMLQNQINPHFIYNTLNSIKWMASIQGATGIAEMTTAFSHLLKSVSKGNRPLIPLCEEFALLNDYCIIQQYRYGGDITIEISEISDESLCNGLIPSFTLQPLVENAIFHGIEPKGGVGSIWLRIYQDESKDVHILIDDDGVGMSDATIESIFHGDEKIENQKYSQIGVQNVHRRIQFAFGEKYGLSIKSELEKYTCVEIVIPFITEPPQSSN